MNPSKGTRPYSPEKNSSVACFLGTARVTEHFVSIVFNWTHIGEGDLNFKGSLQDGRIRLFVLSVGQKATKY